MDSFYGHPRQPPTPPIIRPVGRAPVVPEVSVIENTYLPPNFTHNNSIFGKKHVRFRGPNKENFPETLKTVPDLKGKTFRQIYLANVPDRHLDLSIFEDTPKIGIVESPEAPKLQSIENLRYRDSPPINFHSYQPEVEVSCRTGIAPPKCTEICTLEAPKLQSIENKPRYRDSPPINFSEMRVSSRTAASPPKCTEICTQTEAPSTEIASEPTIKDLFRIIQQQNEQIMLLQRQINNLRTNIRPEIAPETDSPKKGLFSFDVKATSFEFSFRPQKLRKNEFGEAKIQEIQEGESTNLNTSLHLGESLEMKESYASNPPSIAIEMDNYRSSDEEEPEVGPTFYNDLMKQVSKALKKAHRQEAPPDTMKAVKQATLQHLKKMGVNLTPIQESNEVKESDSESEVSCAVQQLLMKYLPSDKLTKVEKPQKNGEFSFATLQYMKKYNLIGEEQPPKAAPRILDVTALKLQPKLL